MWKRIAITTVGLVIILAGLAWLNRKAIILHLVSSRGKVEVAENQPIEWDKGPATAKQSGTPRPPNIIFILADDLGINDISTFGGGVADGAVPTPNIDRLAGSGAIFQNAYSGTATCAPSRAMLLTGRYPTRTGFEFTPTPPGMGRVVSMFAEDTLEDAGLPPMTWNRQADESGVQYADMGLPSEEVTIAETLQTAGYHNVHIGKWHLGRATPFRAVSQGFDESLLMASGLYLPEDDSDVVNAKLDFDPIDIFLWARMQFAADFDRAGETPGDEWFEPASYITDYYTDEALNVIEANRNRPFFLYLAHWGVHSPLQATREDFEAVGDIEPHRERVYAAMIHALDRSVGRIMDKLEAEGLADNTIIVFTSDNGGAGYIGIPEVNAPYRGWKITLFEGGIRVPMFISWPGQIAPGTVIEEPVAHIDVLPTLAAAAGVSMPESIEIDGRNILPLATEEAEVFERPDDAIFWSSGYYKVVRSGDWKLQVNERQSKSWLFNLAEDPTEMVNLIKRHPEKAADLQALIDRHWAGARPPLYPFTTESPVRIDKTNADPAGPDDEYVYWPN
ncbi:MAG TPA: sulfatase [Henriciella marina]|uniref:sulfatase n=1 Tax=Henriciella sp. TaxID=1968823 RepID=UPI00181E0227|nr:sulfatase [Henriciella sp.]HIG22154.1 sulfatase [Henriciella sp.]HIK64362.1 sulfatase [Henriciella marina]